MIMTPQLLRAAELVQLVIVQYQLDSDVFEYHFFLLNYFPHPDIID